MMIVFLLVSTYALNLIINNHCSLLGVSNKFKSPLKITSRYFKTFFFSKIINQGACSQEAGVRKPLGRLKTRPRLAAPAFNTQ